LLDLAWLADGLPSVAFAHRSSILSMISNSVFDCFILEYAKPIFLARLLYGRGVDQVDDFASAQQFRRKQDGVLPFFGIGC
jgi:hypothetical protein